MPEPRPNAPITATNFPHFPRLPLAKLSVGYCRKKIAIKTAAMRLIGFEKTVAIIFNSCKFEAKNLKFGSIPVRVVDLNNGRTQKNLKKIRLTPENLDQLEAGANSVL